MYLKCKKLEADYFIKNQRYDYSTDSLDVVVNLHLPEYQDSKEMFDMFLLFYKGLKDLKILPLIDGEPVLFFQDTVLDHILGDMISNSSFSQKANLFYEGIYLNALNFSRLLYCITFDVEEVRNPFLEFIIFKRVIVHIENAHHEWAINKCGPSHQSIWNEKLPEGDVLIAIQTK